MNRLLKYMYKYWYLYLGGIVTLALGVSLDMYTPIITQKVIDDVVRGGQNELLGWLLKMLLLITIGRSLLGYLKEIFFDLAGVNLILRLRKQLFDHIQGLSINFFDRKNTGELMARVKEDADKIWHASSFGLMLVIEIAIYFVVATFIMFRISPSLALLSILTVPLIGYLAAKLEKSIGSTYEKISEENAKLNTIAQENIAGIRLVKAFAREKHEINKFLKSNETYYKLNMEQAKVLSAFHPKIQVITNLLPTLVVVFGGSLVIGEQLSIGTLIAFVGYMQMIIGPMRMLGWLSNVIAEGVASSKKIDQIFSEESEIKNPKVPVALDNPNGTIEFKDVSLTLNESEVLKNINFRVEKGKTLGIMGETGSGKSSIINLLVRFYDVTEGKVTLDEVDIRELTTDTLRSNISLVMQDVFLFSDTIEENIKLGNKEKIDSEAMVRASNLAQAYEFIDKIEDRFSAIIGERGIGLSGGQKQRISMARALARQCPVLVFDDSTSALDMETEHKIQKAIDKMKDVTKVIIAHRISSVKNADEIIILENGEIVERGTHKELLKQEGRYYKTYIEQYEDYQVI